MTTIRVKKEEKYFAASNEPFNDERLSWESRGLMGYLLSKPNNWEIRKEDLEKKGPAGDHKMRRMLAELRKHGYINRIRIAMPGGTFTWETEIYESPSLNPNPNAKFTRRRFSTTGSSTSGKPPYLISTESESTEAVDERAAALAKLYTGNIGAITPLMADIIRGAVIDYPYQEWYAPAFEIMVKANVRKWSYVEAIFDGWKRNGFGWKPEFKKSNRNGKKPPIPAPQEATEEEQEELCRIAAQLLEEFPG